MSNFNLQQWLDDQHEHNVQLASSEFDELDDLQDVELGGFGFPHYAEIDNPSTNHFLHL